MKIAPRQGTRTALLPALLLTLMAPVTAQQATATVEEGQVTAATAQTVSPQAQAVIERMSGYLRGLQSFSIESRSTRDEVVAFGYKLQHNEHAHLIVQRPNKLRSEVSGDIRDRTFVYDGRRLAIYSPDQAVYVRVDAPDTLAGLIGGLLDAGVDMPMIDVLYQAAGGTLTDDVRGGVLVGSSIIDGVSCDHLAFRQASVDWQLWVERGERPLPRKVVITTRYEAGAPQFEATMQWDLKPKIDASTFVFSAPKGAREIPFRNPAAIRGGAQ